MFSQLRQVSFAEVSIFWWVFIFDWGGVLYIYLKNSSISLKVAQFLEPSNYGIRLYYVHPTLTESLDMVIKQEFNYARVFRELQFALTKVIFLRTLVNWSEVIVCYIQSIIPDNSNKNYSFIIKVFLTSPQDGIQCLHRVDEC